MVHERPRTSLPGRFARRGAEVNPEIRDVGASVPVEPKGEDAPKRQRPVPPAVDNIIARVAVIGLWLGLVQFWMQRHLSVSILTQFEEAPLVATLVPFLLALLDFLGGKKPGSRLQKALRTKLALVLRTPVLIALWASTLVAGSMVSSITVLSVDKQEPAPVTVRPVAKHVRRDPGARPGPAGSERVGGDASPARFLVWSNPFGRGYMIEVEGYRPFPLDVYPWIGKTVQVERDLEPAPSVLVRVPVGLHALLAGGRIELRRPGSAIPLASADTTQGCGAVIFGRNLPLESRMLADWEHELRREGAEGQSLSAAYLAWRSPAVVPLAQPLSPNLALETLFITAGGTNARARFTLTAEALQDILMAEATQ
jgi:hypothetical protein